MRAYGDGSRQATEAATALAEARRAKHEAKSLALRIRDAGTAAKKRAGRAQGTLNEAHMALQKYVSGIPDGNAYSWANPEVSASDELHEAGFTKTNFGHELDFAFIPFNEGKPATISWPRPSIHKEKVSCIALS